MNEPLFCSQCGHKIKPPKPPIIKLPRVIVANQRDEAIYSALLAYPLSSISKIAIVCGIVGGIDGSPQKGTVQRSIKRLEALGRVQRIRGGGGKYKAI